MSVRIKLHLMNAVALCAALYIMTDSNQVLAGEIIVHIGPPSAGTGGTNPTSIPPINPAEYEISWVSPRGIEGNISIVPGVLFGLRSQAGGGLYVGFGGGLVVSVNGIGPGAYSSFGWNVGKKIFFNAELKQAVGVAFGTYEIVSPYALRVGMGVRW